MHYFEYPSVDATIYQASQSMNTGLDPILEVRKDVSPSGDAVNTIIKKIMSIETNPNKVDNKNQNYTNFIYFFLKTKTISLFNYFFYRNKMLYKVQIDKREGLNKAQIQAKVNDLSKIIYPDTKFIVKEKYYGIYYIEKYQS